MRRKEMPARSADPGPSPRFVKNARPNSLHDASVPDIPGDFGFAHGKTLAIVERKRSFPARTDAAYAG
jgi:hypothetical protein